jgi:hypothetical protein
MATISIPPVGDPAVKSYSRDSSFLTTSSDDDIIMNYGNNNQDDDDEESISDVGADILRLSEEMNTLLDSVVLEVNELSNRSLTPKGSRDEQQPPKRTPPLHMDNLSISSEDSDFTADASIKREIGALHAASMELEHELKTSSTDSMENELGRIEQHSDSSPPGNERKLETFPRKKFGMDDKEIIRRILEEDNIMAGKGNNVCGLDKPEESSLLSSEFHYPILTGTAVVWILIYYQIWQLLQHEQFWIFSGIATLLLFIFWGATR